MLKKIVPDPPSTLVHAAPSTLSLPHAIQPKVYEEPVGISGRKPRSLTAHSHFGTCHHSHKPMFSVHAGFDGEDAMVCAVAALKAAYETNGLALEKAKDPMRSLLTATENSLEKGLALVEAVLDGLEKAS